MDHTVNFLSRANRRRCNSHTEIRDPQCHLGGGMPYSSFSQQQRKQLTTSNEYVHNTAAGSSELGLDQCLQTTNTICNPRLGTMSQSTSMSTSIMGAVPDLLPSGLGEIHYNPLLEYDSSLNVFNFQNSLPLTNETSDATMTSDVPQKDHCSADTGGRPSNFANDASIEDRFNFVAEAVYKADFKSIDDMVLSYYTAAFDEDSDIFHEQRMSRKRGLPAMISKLRGCTAAWQEYEREAYEAEILKNAEKLLTDECRRVLSSPGFKDRLVQLRRGAVYSTPPSTSSSPFQDSGFGRISSSNPNKQAFSFGGSHPKTWLSEELPNVWNLLSALSGCRAGSQTVATALMTLCFASHLQAEEIKLILLENTCNT